MDFKPSIFLLAKKVTPGILSGVTFLLIYGLLIYESELIPVYLFLHGRGAVRCGPVAAAATAHPAYTQPQASSAAIGAGRGIAGARDH